MTAAVIGAYLIALCTGVQAVTKIGSTIDKIDDPGLDRDELLTLVYDCVVWLGLFTGTVLLLIDSVGTSGVLSGISVGMGLILSAAKLWRLRPTVGD